MAVAAAIAQEGAAPARLVVRDCPICASAPSHGLAKYSREPWHLVTCDSCGFVYLREAPAYDRLVDELAWEKSWLQEKERRRKGNPLAGLSPRRSMDNAKASKKARVAKLFAPGNVLDIGCGGDTLTPEGFTPFGIEISETLHAKADAIMRARGGACVHAPAVEGVASFPDKFFSGIILSSFLEHEMQPAKLLAECARVLQPGGAIYVRVPRQLFHPRQPDRARRAFRAETAPAESLASRVRRQHQRCPDEGHARGGMGVNALVFSYCNADGPQGPQ
jgi:SAM-dependent methyltransferase